VSCSSRRPPGSQDEPAQGRLGGRSRGGVHLPAGTGHRARARLRLDADDARRDERQRGSRALLFDESDCAYRGDANDRDVDESQELPALGRPARRTCFCREQASLAQLVASISSTVRLGTCSSSRACTSSASVETTAFSALRDADRYSGSTRFRSLFDEMPRSATTTSPGNLACFQNNSPPIGGGERSERPALPFLVTFDAVAAADGRGHVCGGT
jgi:hypothetical protein